MRGFAAAQRGRRHCLPDTRTRHELLTDPQAWIAFATLTALELVLGIDNIIFISILVDKLPRPSASWRADRPVHGHVHAHRAAAGAGLDRRPGGAAVHRAGQAISGRDLILILGGLFLIWKSTTGEIHQSLEGEEGQVSSAVKATFTAVILQIMVIDLVFSLDSIITAVGMVDDVRIMIAAVVASVALMMLFAGPIGRFVSAHPTIKMLALSLPGGGRRGAGGRRLRPPRAQGLRVLRDGLLAGRGDAQHHDAQALACRR
jgi:hypothetical protein